MKKIMQWTGWGLGMIFLFFGTGLQGQGVPDTGIYEGAKRIIIDPLTGKLSNCDLLEYVGEFTWKDDSLKRVEYNKAVKNIVININKKNKNSPKVTSGIISSDHKFLVTNKPGIEDVYFYDFVFYDSSGTLLNEYTLDRRTTAAATFNADNTFFVISGLFSGPYYFFTSSGKLVRKGDINQLEKDSGTSYYTNDISKTGRVWLLNNNYIYFYNEKNELICKISGPTGQSYIDEEKGLVYLRLSFFLAVFDYINNKMLYITDYRPNGLEIVGKNIKLVNHSKTGYYVYRIK